MGVLHTVERGIATITLDNPHNRNALSRELVESVSAHLESDATDDAVRAIVLTHTGTVFCAGADLKEQSAEGGPQEGTRRMLGLLQAIVELPKPVITRIDGAVRAGGLGIVGASDIAIASEQATFAFTEVRLGLAPAIISLTTLGRMTARSASALYLTGEVFGATAAAMSGLITAAVADIDAEVTRSCDSLRRCSPQGLAETKPLTTRSALEAFQRSGEVQAQSARLFGSDEAREGMLAFLEKRPPRWVAEQDTE